MQADGAEAVELIVVQLVLLAIISLLKNMDIGVQTGTMIGIVMGILTTVVTAMIEILGVSVKTGPQWILKSQAG